jgi:hypothetical protein
MTQDDLGEEVSDAWYDPQESLIYITETFLWFRLNRFRTRVWHTPRTLMTGSPQALPHSLQHLHLHFPVEAQ